MISQINSATVRNSYASASGENKQTEKATNITKQGDTSKVDQIKEALESGEYKVNIEALSRKIADELM